jgi:hypothetical protein
MFLLFGMLWRVVLRNHVCLSWSWRQLIHICQTRLRYYAEDAISTHHLKWLYARKYLEFKVDRTFSNSEVTRSEWWPEAGLGDCDFSGRYAVTPDSILTWTHHDLFLPHPYHISVKIIVPNDAKVFVYEAEKQSINKYINKRLVS